jgi:hypothetical protein
MPNNTDVRVYIDHPSKKRIDDMVNIFEGERPFDMIIPMPDDIIRDNLTYEMRKKSNGRNWYDWSCENWGTKWDAYEVRVQRLSDTSMYVMMETAWSPPIPVFRKLEEMGFKIEAIFLDEGHMYVGQYIDGVEEMFDVSLEDAPPSLIEEFNLEAEFENDD